MVAYNRYMTCVDCALGDRRLLTFAAGIVPMHMIAGKSPTMYVFWWDGMFLNPGLSGPESL